MPYVAVAIIVTIVILAVEILLWRLFRARIEGLILPRSSDSSSLHFFSIARVGGCAFIHTVVLILFCNIVLFLFW